MGKKKKNKNKNKFKKISSKRVSSFLTDNSLLLAVLGGAAAGISLAALLGTEKAKQIVDNISESAKNIASKLDNGMEGISDHVGVKHSVKANRLEKQHA